MSFVRILLKRYWRNLLLLLIIYSYICFSILIISTFKKEIYRLPQNSNGFSFLCDRSKVNVFVPCLCHADFSIKKSASNVKCALTFAEGGRMGNYIGQYAALYTLAKLNRRPALLTPGMATVLQKYFKISIPVMSQEFYQSVNWSNKWIDDKMDISYTRWTGNFLQIYGFPSSYTFFHQYRKEIRQEFRLRDEIHCRAQDILRNIKISKTSTTVTYVGVHVRRGDYVHLMKNVYRGVVADKSFFLEATSYFRLRYTDVIFVVVSNDMKWCEENIVNDADDVYFVGNNNESDPITDFAVLMNCNHSIITIGTFSFFSAFLAGGDTVYLTNYTMSDSSWRKIFYFDTAFPPSWHPLPANLSIYSTLNNSTVPN